jgi:hypothetical protein
LDADFSIDVTTANSDFEVLIDGYDRPINSNHAYKTPLVLATDYISTATLRTICALGAKSRMG